MKLHPNKTYNGKQEKYKLLTENCNLNVNYKSELKILKYNDCSK